MPVTVIPVNIATDTWSDLISKMNEVIGVVSNQAVTAGGDAAVGNVEVHGQFYANTVVTDLLQVDVGQVESLTANTSDTETANVNNLTANIALITSANVESISVTANLTINVDNFHASGGDANAKFMVTDGSGNISFYHPELTDLSDFLTFQTNINNTVNDVDNNAIVYAIALG